MLITLSLNPVSMLSEVSVTASSSYFVLSFLSEAYSITDLYSESQIFLLTPTSFSISNQNLSYRPAKVQELKFLNSCCLSSTSPQASTHNFSLLRLCPLIYEVHRGTESTSHVIVRYNVLNCFFLEYLDVII